jgi:hypothetical protein
MNVTTAFAYDAEGSGKVSNGNCTCKKIVTSSPKLANSRGRNWPSANPTVSKNMLAAIRVRIDSFLREYNREAASVGGLFVVLSPSVPLSACE